MIAVVCWRLFRSVVVDMLRLRMFRYDDSTMFDGQRYGRSLDRCTIVVGCRLSGRIRVADCRYNGCLLYRYGMVSRLLVVRLWLLCYRLLLLINRLNYLIAVCCYRL